jgi:transposase
MPAPLSNDLRKRLVKAVDDGMSRNAAAAKFDVSISAVVKLIQHWKVTGSYEPKPSGGYRGHKLTEHRGSVEKMLKEKPDITLGEMKKKLEAVKIYVSTSAIDRFLNHLGHSYKKNGTRA